MEFILPQTDITLSLYILMVPVFALPFTVSEVLLLRVVVPEHSNESTIRFISLFSALNLVHLTLPPK